MIVPCPTCKKDVEYDVQNKFRPFCSERCRLIDLGEWADGKYAVATEDSGEAPEASKDQEDPEE